MPCKELVRTLENTPTLYRPCTASFDTGSRKTGRLSILRTNRRGCLGVILVDAEIRCRGAEASIYALDLRQPQSSENERLAGRVIWIAEKPGQHKSVFTCISVNSLRIIAFLRRC